MPFLHRRVDTFFYRISVPLELRKTIGCREMTMSLRTSDRLIAQPTALELAAISKRLFFDLRKIMANSNSKLDLMIRMKIAQEQIKQRWLKEEHEAEINRLQETMRSERKLHKVQLDIYKEIVQKPGYVIPVSSHSETSTGIDLPLKLHKLSDLIPTWISIQNPAKSSIVAFKFAASRFEKLLPQLHVETTKPEHINDFINKLLGMDLNPKTISKDHSMISALLNIAISQKWIKENPATGVKLPSKKVSKPPVRGYRIDEMNSIFNSPVFNKGERPKAGKGEA